VPRQQYDRVRILLAPQQFDRLAPVHIGQADIENRQIGRLPARGCDALASRSSLDDDEFLVQRELFGQRHAKVRIVIHDQNFADLRHRVHPSEIGRRFRKS